MASALHRTVGETTRSGNHRDDTQPGDPRLLVFLLRRRSHTPLPESARRMRLLLFLLHDPLRARPEPQRLDRRDGGASTRGGPARREGDCIDRREYRRFREKHERDLHRPDPGLGRGRRHRPVSHLLHRAEPDHGRGDRLRGQQPTLRPAFPHPAAKRLQRRAQTDATPLRHGALPA